MKLLVNGVAARLGGGRRNLNPLVVALADDLEDADIQVFVPPDFEVQVTHPRVEWTRIDVPQGVSLRRLWWDNVTVPQIGRRADAIFSPLNFGPVFTSRPHVICQCNALYFDRAFIKTQSLRIRLTLETRRLLAAACMHRADAVITPTESMAAMIRPLLRDQTKVSAEFHGFDVEGAQEMAERPLVASAERWRDGEVRLLHIGHPYDQKNLPMLARTLQRVIDSLPGTPVTLAVTFDKQHSQSSVAEFVDAAKACGVLNRVSFLGAVPNHDVYALYRHAHVLLLPSTSESFGIPVLEAFSVGTAVVASDIDAIAEVAGGLAYLHEPLNDVQAAEAVLTALCEDSCLADLRRSRAAEFSPAREAQAVSRLLQDAVSSRRQRPAN